MTATETAATHALDATWELLDRQAHELLEQAHALRNQAERELDGTVVQAALRVAATNLDEAAARLLVDRTATRRLRNTAR